MITDEHGDTLRALAEKRGREADLRINAPLLRKVLDHITARPWEWYQGSWYIPVSGRVANLRLYSTSEDLAAIGMTRERLHEVMQAQDYTCKSAFCVAGWAAYFHHGDYTGGATVSVTTGRFSVPSEQHVQDYATAALGLSSDDASMLFGGSNTLPEVTRLIEGFIARHDEALATA